MEIIDLNEKTTTIKEKKNPKTDDVITHFNNGNSYAHYIGGFKLLPSFDETTPVPTDIIDFGVDENGDQIVKSFEDCFFIFELNNKRYIYSCAYFNGKNNSDSLPPINLLVMANYFGKSKALSPDEFYALYLEYNASITPTI